MAKWKLDKGETKVHDGGAETVTYEARILLDVNDPDNVVTLADLSTLIGNLTSVDGIPTAAKLGTTIDAVLTWTDADLPP